MCILLCVDTYWYALVLAFCRFLNTPNLELFFQHSFVNQPLFESVNFCEMTRNWFEVVPSKYTFRSGIKLEFDGLVFEGRFVWRSWELKDGEIPGFICSDVTVIATAVPEEINLYREFPRSLDSCSRIIMMWDQFLSREREGPYAVSLFLFGGGMYTCWDVPRMVDKRGIPQTMMSRLCGMLRSESSSGRSGAMLRFFPGKEFDFPNEKQWYWTGRSYSVVNCQMVKWYLKISGHMCCISS